MSSLLEDLPSEVLNSILEYNSIPPNASPREASCSRRDYLSLCCTSKTLYRAATPYLYRHFRSSVVGRPSLTTLVKNVCADRSLAVLFRSMQISANPGILSVEREELEIFKTQLSLRIRDAEVFDEMVTALAAGCVTAQMLVLITAAPNLRHLDFGVARSIHYDSQFPCAQALKWFLTLFTDAQSRGMFNRLQHLVIRNSGRQSEESPQYVDITELLRLPSLRKFETIGVRSLVNRGRDLKPSSSLRHIHLDQVSIDTDALQGIIESTTALTTLKVCLSGHDSPSHKINPARVLASLRRHQTSLTELQVIDAAPDSDSFSPGSFLGSLAEFESLRDLTVDEHLLCHGSSEDNNGWADANVSHTLPPGLVNLTVHTHGSVHHLGRICEAFGTFEGKNFKSFHATFRYSCLDTVEGPSNCLDIGLLSQPQGGPDLPRLDFDCLVNSAPHTLAQVSRLLLGIDGHDVIRCMLSQAPLSVDHDGSIVVYKARDRRERREAHREALKEALGVGVSSEDEELFDDAEYYDD